MSNYIVDGAASPLSPVRAKLFGADAAGNVGWFNPFVLSKSITPSGDTTGVADSEAIAACITTLAGKGGRISFAEGDYYFAETIPINVGYVSTLGKLGLVFDGDSIGATRLHLVTAGIPLFQKSDGVGHALRNLYCYGPGTGNAATLGITWDNAAGAGHWENVWFENFAVGSRFIDATLMTFSACMWRANARNIELGFNCDIFNFNGCRLDNASDTSVFLGYRDSAHLTGALQINNIFFNGCRISNNNIAVDIADYGASNIVFNAYFESNAKVAWVGDAAQTTGPKNIVFENSFFTVVNQDNCQIGCRNANQESSFVIRSCRSDGNAPQGWLSMGLNSRLIWEDNDLLSAAKHVIWNGYSYLLDKKNRVHVENGLFGLYDGSVMGTNVPLDIRMTNGIGKIYQQWTRRNAGTGGVLGIADSKVIDIDGKFVCLSGPILIATPSSALPTPAATYRGIMAYQQGASGAQDTVKCCMKSAGDTYSWVTVIGG